MNSENTDNKRAIRETSRWLRVGFFTLTVLGPVINSVTARRRELADDAPQTGAANKEAPTYDIGYVQAKPEKPALSESLLELKDRPYAQELLRRSEELAEELRKRGVTLSQVLTERGGKMTRDLAELSSNLTRDLVEQGNKTSRELLKRSEKTARKLAKRGKRTSKTFDKRSEKLAEQLTRRGEQIAKELNERGRALGRDLAHRNDTRLTVMGFGVGLIAAAVGAFVYVNRRMKPVVEGDQHVLLSQNGHLNNGASGVATESRSAEPELTESKEVAPVAIILEEQPATTTEQDVPVDAMLLGVVSTKLYYPVETPLDQLLTEQKEAVDIIYFSSEDDAREQGYLPA